MQQGQLNMGMASTAHELDDELLASAVLDTVDTLVVVFDRRGRIVQFNRACEEATGYAFAEVAGEPFWDRFLIPEEKTVVQKRFAQLLNSQIPSRGQNFWVCKDGRRRLIAWSNRPFIDQAGKTRYIISAGNDITEREQTVQLINASESLQRVTTAVLQDLTTIDHVMHVVCREARLLTGASGSAVWLQEDDRFLRLQNSSGVPEPAQPRLELDSGLAGCVLQRREPLRQNSPHEQVHGCRRNPDLQTFLAVPLCVDDTPRGILDVVNKPGGFTDEDVQIMMLFAEQAAFALDHARLHEQAEKLAVLEERQRLARELHDSVTQTMYSVNLYADATKMALDAKKIDTVEAHLQELRTLTREAMLDMRLLIFELHTPVVEKEGLATAINTRLEAVETRAGIDTTLRVHGNEGRLPLAYEEELYRIAQEGLNNVVKHARATKVVIDLFFTPEALTLRLQDNGSGFDPQQVRNHGGMGLPGITERVARLGGDLKLRSAPGEGTTILVTVAR